MRLLPWVTLWIGLWLLCGPGLRPAQAAKPLRPASELPVPRLHVHIDTWKSAVTVQPVDSPLKYFTTGVLTMALFDMLEAELSQQDRKRAQPVSAAMSAVDLGQQWRDLLEQGLDRTHLAHQLVIDHNRLPTEFRARIGQLPAQPRVLRLLPAVWFDPDFRELRVTLIWSYGELRVAEGMNGRQVWHKLFRVGEVVFAIPLPDSPTRPRTESQRVQVWLAQGVPQLSTWIQQGMQETLRMLNHDLRLSVWEAKGPKLRSAQGRALGHEIHRSAGARWARRKAVITAIPTH